MSKTHRGGNSYQRRKARRSMNLHHIVNKCHKGKATDQNLLLLVREKHDAWHFIFKNKSFLDVVKLLVRCLKMKRHQDYQEAQEVLDEYEAEMD